MEAAPDIYNNTGKTVEIADEAYDGWHYKIRSVHGCYPCCYIEIPEGHPWYKMDYNQIMKWINQNNKTFKVHGGLTYSGNPELLNNWWIGWDYAHSGDYIHGVSKPFVGGLKRRYSFVDLIEDIHNAVDQLNGIFKEG